MKKYYIFILDKYIIKVYFNRGGDNMSISLKIKALLALTGKKQSDLMVALGMSSKQSLSNKFTNERWSAEDLVTIAGECGCRVAFIFSDGQQITIE